MKSAIQELEDFLSLQSGKTRSKIGIRSAMRLLPVISSADHQQFLKARLLLRGVRSLLAADAAWYFGSNDLVEAAKKASSSDFDADSLAIQFRSNTPNVFAEVADVVTVPALVDHNEPAAVVVGNIDRAYPRLNIEIASRDAKALSDLPEKDLATVVNEVPQELSIQISKETFGQEDLLRTGGPWSFWEEWYDRAMMGNPLPWDLQRQVALIDDKIWKAGPAAVADEIERIQRDHIIGKGRLLETLVLDAEVPLYTAKVVEVRNMDRVLRHLSRVDDALDDLCALTGNNSLTEESSEHRIIKRLVRKYSNDPERIAFDLTDVNNSISRQIRSGEYPGSEPFTLLQAASTACVSTICDMAPEIAMELRREYPAPAVVPDETELSDLEEALQLSAEVLDQSAAQTTEEDIAELFYGHIIDAAAEDPINGPVSVAREYRAIVLRRQISRLSQIARDVVSVQKLAKHYDSQASKAAGVLMRYGGVAGLFWHAVKLIGRILGLT